MDSYKTLGFCLLLLEAATFCKSSHAQTRTTTALEQLCNQPTETLTAQAHADELTKMAITNKIQLIDIDLDQANSSVHRLETAWDGIKTAKEFVITAGLDKPDIDKINFALRHTGKRVSAREVEQDNLLSQLQTYGRETVSELSSTLKQQEVLLKQKQSLQKAHIQLLFGDAGIRDLLINYGFKAELCGGNTR